MKQIINKCRVKYRNICKLYFPRKYADMLYYDTFGYRIDWKHPRDLNEIINYLAFNTDTTMWSKCADKYAVREYVKEKGLENLLIPLLGHWMAPDDIPFDALPRPFVLKMNNGYGDVLFVKESSSLSKQAVVNHFKSAIQNKHGLASAEPHYLKIQPQIIAEQYIATDDKPLVDYKIWCFNGKPYSIFTVSNRDYQTHIGKCAVYDKDWNRQDYNLSKQYRNDVPVKKPDCLSEMLRYAAILSEGFPQVRVDFYEVNGKVYFGEMTFTAACGRMVSLSPEYLKELASMVRI